MMLNHPDSIIIPERIAIARALLRNPKVLLLDEVRVMIFSAWLVYSRVILLGHFRTGLELRESGARCTGPGG